MEAQSTSNIKAVEGSESVRELWGLELQPAGCPLCRQAFLIEAAWLGKACPNCGQGKLEAQPALLRSEPPELLVPFEQKFAQLPALFQRFTDGVWLHTPDFTPEMLARRAVPVYWPMWLVDSDLRGIWQAEVGYDYQVKSSQESYGSGSWQTRETVETRIRWEPRTGQIERHYNNIAVPARSDHERMKLLTGQYNLKRSIAYQPERAAQTGVQVPDQNPENAWSQARESLNRAAGEECQQAANGQHIRSFGIRAEYCNQHWTQLLLPVFTSYYLDDDGKAHMVFVNGQTGFVGGQKVASLKKGWQVAAVIGVVAAILLVLGLIGIGTGLLIPGAAVVGGALAISGLVAGIAAFIPPIWAWMYNRNTT